MESKCQQCGAITGSVDSCTEWSGLDKLGKAYQAIPFSGDDRCPECGVASGGIHHAGCSLEICPKCKGSLQKCNVCDIDVKYKGKDY